MSPVSTRKRRTLLTKDGVRRALPIFLPVYQPREPVFQLAREEIDGCIVNAYFLYKQRDLRERLTRAVVAQGPCRL